MASEEIRKAPGAWQCRAQVYSMVLRIPAAQAEDFPAVAYSPLEGSSVFADPRNGRPVGGFGGIMIVRYSDTPVGPYDELAILPGGFTYPAGEETPERGPAEGKALRITRIYVSQRHTTWNGRHNWNIPKHLARFEWKDLPDGALSLKVFPFDGEVAAGAAETKPGSKPFFQTNFQTVPFVPGFPATTSAVRLFGVKPTLVQPPLPQGGEEELVGTDRFARADVGATSWKTHIGWFDMSQKDDDGKATGEHENFWPGLKQRAFGARMDNATFRISEGRYWPAPN